MSLGSGTGFEEIGNPILDAIKARWGALPPMLGTLMQASAAAVPRPGTENAAKPAPGAPGLRAKKRPDEDLGP